MIVQVGGNRVSIQVQSSGLGAAQALSLAMAEEVAAAAASATAAATAETGAEAAQAAAAASAAAAAATLADAALKSANLSDLVSPSSARTNLGSTVTGDAVFTAANAAAARTAIDAVGLTQLAGSTGGDLVGVLQSGAAAALRTLESKLTEVKHITDFGIVPLAAYDDGVDVTAEINAALADCSNCEVVFPKGIYMVQAGSSDTSHSGTHTVITGAIQVPSNIKLRGEPGAIIKCISTVEDSGSAFWLFDVDNVVIEGFEVIGDKDTHLGVGGQGLSGLMNYGSRNVHIIGTTFRNWWADGLNVQGDGNSVAAEAMYLIDVLCDDNGRNGLSVIHVEDFSAIGCRFSNTDRQDPQAGVDVEPNPGQYVKNARFVSCEFVGNTTYGFISGPQSSPTTRGQVTGLTLVGCVSRGQPYNYVIEADSVSYMLAPTLTDCVSEDGPGVTTIYDFRIRNTKFGVFTRCQALSTTSTYGFYVRGEYVAYRLIGNSSVGTFAYGETVTGGTSGATAIVIAWAAGTHNLEVRAVTGTFTALETITGGTSGATMVLKNALLEPPSFNNRFIGCLARGSAGSGFNSDADSRQNVFHGCTAISNAGIGIRLLTPENVIDSCLVYANTLGGILLNTGSDRTMVLNSRIEGNAGTGLQIAGTSPECLVANNIFRHRGVQGTGILCNSTTGYSRFIGNDWFGGGTSNDVNFVDTTSVLIGNVVVQNQPHFRAGAGTPEAAVTAPIGSLFQRTNGGNSTSVYVKESGTGNTGWRPIAGYLSGSATYDPPSLVDADGATTTVTVTGAALGDFATATFSLDLQGITVTAWVSAADTVSVRLQNETGGTIDLASGTLRARVEKV